MDTIPRHDPPVDSPIWADLCHACPSLIDVDRDALAAGEAGRPIASAVWPRLPLIVRPHAPLWMPALLLTLAANLGAAEGVGQ